MKAASRSTAGRSTRGFVVQKVTSQVQILPAGSSSSSTADVEDDHVYYGDDEDAAVLAEGIIFIIRVSMHTLIQIK